MSVSIDHLSLRELQELQASVGKLIERRRLEERAKVMLELEALAEERGFDLRALIEGGDKKNPSRKPPRNIAIPPIPSRHGRGGGASRNGWRNTSRVANQSIA